MSTPGSDLSVRRYERVLCDLRAAVAIGPASQGAVRLARGATSGDGAIAARVVDCSQGGLGLEAGVFLPQTCRLDLCLTGPAGESIRTTLRVQRVAMSSRKPSYYIGTAFEGEDPARDSAFERLVAGLKAAGAKVVGGTGEATRA
jgi:hypothetical protein